MSSFEPHRPVIFRDAHQRSAACRALLATGGLERLWTNHGPSVEACVRARESSSLAPGERALLLTALSLWTGEPSVLRLDELVGLEESEPIGRLMIAAIYGPRAIDVWLTRSDDVELFVATPRETHAAAAELFDEARAVFAECGDEPMNLGAAPDACALGAFRMASYMLIDGVEPVDDDERHALAMELTVHVLGMSAATESALSRDVDGDDPRETEQLG